jgi:hypothetical protein
MLLAADHVPPATDGIEVDDVEVDEVEVGEPVDGLDKGPLPLLEQAVATAPASMQAIIAAASRGRCAAYREPRTLRIMLALPRLGLGATRVAAEALHVDELRDCLTGITHLNLLTPKRGTAFDEKHCTLPVNRPVC